VRPLDRQSSPLLTKDHPKLSTLDRCVELLPSSIFTELCSQSQTRLGVSSLGSEANQRAGTLRSLSSPADTDQTTAQRSLSLSPGLRTGAQRSISYPSGGGDQSIVKQTAPPSPRAARELDRTLRFVATHTVDMIIILFHCLVSQ